LLCGAVSFDVTKDASFRNFCVIVTQHPVFTLIEHVSLGAWEGM
jgi:hypothetical protein